MVNWPIKSTDATQARDEMLGSYRPVPLPAYSVSGDLIHPDECQKLLPGSVCRVLFTLSHWYINNQKKGGDEKNVFVADVQSIRVLNDPPRSVMSPRKRRTANRDPGLLRSPSKFKSLGS